MKKPAACFSLPLFISIVLLFMACRQQQPTTLFTALSSQQSGINFTNQVNENDSTNSFINEFGYMGGGVGIGDFNNDGLKDIFFTGNQSSCSLYINKGNLQFQDITAAAGLTTHAWATGVSIVDINHDGYDDIYVSVFGKDLKHPAGNLLFINQHDLSFREMAASYGLADMGYSTQAVFLDYDGDGDLDMYLANYRLNGPNANTVYPRDRSGFSPANDKLYRNEGFSPRLGHDSFSDVSRQAGIREDGYGLGLVTSDFNGDGWPDIYVANDFVSNDELWLNNKKGGFYNAIDKAMGHQSYSSMGADAADLNNDGLPDLVTLDMAPQYNDRRKQTFFFMNYDRYLAERNLGYEPEFSRNMLQLNNRRADSIPFFNEIGQLAGISETDWSWSVLLADFDNDGWKDMHITNGVGRDFINGDFLEFSNNIFSSSRTQEEQRNAIKAKLASLEPLKLRNYLYLNNRDYTYADASAAAGIDAPSLSNGAAYADLDNDGDLDLVVNNINDPAFVFINNSRQLADSARNHYIKIRLLGDSLNTRSLGAWVTVYAGASKQMQEENPVRGYLSSVDRDLVFGLGRQAKADSIIIRWPDRRWTVIKQVPADTLIQVAFSEQQLAPGSWQAMAPPPFIEDHESGISFGHHENVYNDFSLQRLLPQKYSQMGPFITTADVNGDGLMDFFVGNGFNYSGQLFIQGKNQHFTAKNLVDSIKTEEDLDCVFFDADHDGDSDLLVTGGDIQYSENPAAYRPRLYLNDGKGNFTLHTDAIPAGVNTVAGCVKVADYDGDGYPDLFIGGRVSASYPVAPASFLLRNNKGIFIDVTAAVCPALQQAGMVSAAQWVDIDGDKWPDLVIAGEWMPLRFFRNRSGHLQEMTDSTGLTAINGMWRSLVAADMDGDGDMDLVAGNLGLNCVYHASPETPMKLYAADIDGNGRIDPVFFYYIRDEDGVRRLHPGVSRSLLAEQVPSVKKTFLRYKDYAKAGLDDIFKPSVKQNMLSFSCDETRTCWFENNGHGKFVKHPLPVQAQFAPVNAIVADDINGDGYKDLILAGNEYQADVITGRYDASYGCVLLGSRSGGFTVMPAAESGLFLKGDVKSMVLLTVDNGKWLLAGVNNDSLKVFHLRSPF